LRLSECHKSWWFSQCSSRPQLLEVLFKTEMMLQAAGTFLSTGACTALQALFEHLVALLNAGTATLKQAVETLGQCGKLLLMPEPLVARLEALSQQQIRRLSWQQLGNVGNVGRCVRLQLLSRERACQLPRMPTL